MNTTPSETTAPPVTVDRAEAHELVVRILDRLVYFVLPVAVIALAASLVRSFGMGWSVLAGLHTGLVAAAAALLLLRRRLPHRVLLWGVGLVLVANGLTNLVFMGLASLGLLALSGSAVFLAVSFGRRVGVLSTLLLLAASVGLGLALYRGLLPLTPPGADYLRAPATWLSQLTGFALYTGLTVACVSAVQEGLSRQARQLERANADLQRAESDLRERERRYRLLAENMQDLMFVLDTDLNITYSSPSVEHLLGYTPDEATGLRPEDYLTPASLLRLQESLARYMPKLQSGEIEDLPLMQYEYRRKDGSTFVGELRVTMIRDDAGHPVASQGILRDVTDRHRAEQDKARLEEQLRQSEKLQAIGELAGGVAHDFNNQLTGILGSADLLSMELSPDSQLRIYVEQIITSARRAADLTSKLLAFARRGRYRSVPVDLNELLEEVAAILERSIDRSIVVRRELAGGPLMTRGDPTQIQNALLNIALNARDAMPRGGELVFRSGPVELEQPASMSTGAILEPGRYLRVTLTDQGVGMAPEVMQRIFEPFFTTKDTGHGTGMGLAATYGTVKAHGGAIDVRSAPGQGTTFTLYFPALDAPQTAEHEPAEPQAATAPAAGNVLVVEDEPVVLRNLEQMLRRLGYRVASCSRGDKALERFRAMEPIPDVVVLDMNLPGVSGHEVFEQLRRTAPHVPVLICSGHSLEDALRGLLDHGNVARLQKPFKLAELQRVLQQLTGPTDR